MMFLLTIGTVSALTIGEDDSIGVIIKKAVSSVTTFLGLDDTPASYSGAGSQCVKVNAGEDALEFGACSAGDSGLTDTVGPYLSDNVTTVFFDEAFLNATIDARDTDTNTQKTTNGFFLFNDSVTIFFNQTMLNDTIDARVIPDTNTQKNTNGFYLFNDSITIFFNETTLNDTIDARSISATENIFDQDLNTTDIVTFVNVTITDTLIGGIGEINAGDLNVSDGNIDVSDNVTLGGRLCLNPNDCDAGYIEWNGTAIIIQG